MDGMDLKFVKAKIGSTRDNVDALKVEVTVSRAKRANSPKTALKSRPFRSGRPLRSCMASDLKRQSDLYRSG
jgi:hypothetical protein